jgi:hypothetical protein
MGTGRGHGVVRDGSAERRARVEMRGTIMQRGRFIRTIFGAGPTGAAAATLLLTGLLSATAWAQATEEEVEALKSKTDVHDTEIQDAKGKLDLNRGDIDRHQSDIDALRHSDNDKASRIAEIEAAIAALQQELANIELTPGPQGEPGPQGPQGEPGPPGTNGVESEPRITRVSADPRIQRQESDVSFNAEVTGGKAPLSFLWDFGDGTGATSTVRNPIYPYPFPGKWVATVTVTDSKGLSDSATMEMTVAPDTVPIIALVANPTSGTAPLEVSFTIDALDGDPPFTFHWEFGDGGISTGLSAIHTFSVPGTYIVTLEVRDADDDIVSKQVAISVL